MELSSTTRDKIKALEGQRVIIRLEHDPTTEITGTLRAIYPDGGAKYEDEYGRVRYLWPVLDIRAVRRHKAPRVPWTARRAAAMTVLVITVLTVLAILLDLGWWHWLTTGTAMICLPSCKKPAPSQAHCAECHETFGGVRGFDLHREGTVADRSCLHPEAMGLIKDDRGVWVQPRSAQRSHPMAHSTNHREPRSDETGEVGTPGTPS